MRAISITLRLLKVLLLVVIAWGLAPLAVLNAQDVEPESLQKELAEKNLKPFAGAYKEVNEIHNTYQQRIVESTSEQAQVDALQQEANHKMSQAVTAHGLSIEDYNAIFKAILNDPELKEEFMTVLNKTP